MLASGPLILTFAPRAAISGMQMSESDHQALSRELRAGPDAPQNRSNASHQHETLVPLIAPAKKHASMLLWNLGRMGEQESLSSAGTQRD